MVIGQRLRALREEKKLSQGEIEQRSGLLRCYISRVENGHTIPSIETLEKLARALQIPLYQLFYDGEEPPKLQIIPKGMKNSAEHWGYSGKWAGFMHRFRTLLGNMEEGDRKLLLFVALRMARKNRA
jgi:transcriptional regulator with XRE-family HTH domain